MKCVMKVIDNYYTGLDLVKSMLVSITATSITIPPSQHHGSLFQLCFVKLVNIERVLRQDASDGLGLL